MLIQIALRVAMELVGGVFVPRRRTPMVRPPPPHPARVQAIETAYRTWAAELGLLADGARYRGNVGPHAVRVWPGLDGSAPIGVEVEADVSHGHERSVLLRSATDGEAPIEKALALLLEDPALVRGLRSVALYGAGLRLRFAALTSPDVVEQAMRSALDIAESFRPAQANPYR